MIQFAGGVTESASRSMMASIATRSAAATAQLAEAASPSAGSLSRSSSAVARSARFTAACMRETIASGVSPSGGASGGS